jgi:hypothetical protein
LVVEQASSQYDEWLMQRRPKPKARPPAPKPNSIEVPSKEYDEYLADKKAGRLPVAI